MKKRHGFTLIEVAVAAALLAILAAATVPSFVEYLEQRDTESTAKTLSAIAAGIVSFQTNVRTAAAATTSTYPGKISYLTATTLLTNGTDVNSCNNAVNTWNGATQLTTTFAAAAPFTTFYIPTGGLQTPLGQVQDVLVRNPASTATVGRIEIVMPSIDSLDAMRLERYIDGDDGTAAGGNRSAGTFRINSITWPTMKANVSYVVPVGARC